MSKVFSHIAANLLSLKYLLYLKQLIGSSKTREGENLTAVSEKPFPYIHRMFLKSERCYLKSAG